MQRKIHNTGDDSGNLQFCQENNFAAGHAMSAQKSPNQTFVIQIVEGNALGT